MHFVELWLILGTTSSSEGVGYAYVTLPSGGTWMIFGTNTFYTSSPLDSGASNSPSAKTGTITQSAPNSNTTTITYYGAVFSRWYYT